MVSAYIQQEAPRSEETKMHTDTRTRFGRLGDALTVLLVTVLLVTAASQFPAAAAETKPRTFPTPEEAASALAAACKSADSKAIFEVLGSSAKPIITSGDPVADRETREHFVEKYEESNSLAKTGDATAVLQIGKDNWPFPIPLVKTDGGWRFDVDAGKEEILNRRIGRNEHDAIEVCLAYVDAQREYYLRNPDGDKLLHYAQKGASTAGKRDGLYWETKEGEEPSPFGPLFADAQTRGYAPAQKGASGKRQPYYGYYYRLLTAQGPDASGGAYDYVVQGKMIGGFGLVAYPAKYGNSGVMTFIVNHDGVVFQKDLGPKTAATAQAMKAFNPDASWTRVEDPGQGGTATR